MNVLNFVAGDLVPTKPGDYLVITQDMQYHHVTAEFDGDEFCRFVSRKNQTINCMDVLAYSSIKPTATVIQQIYQQEKAPKLSVVGESVPA